MKNYYFRKILYTVELANNLYGSILRCQNGHFIYLSILILKQSIIICIHASRIINLKFILDPFCTRLQILPSYWNRVPCRRRQAVVAYVLLQSPSNEKGVGVPKIYWALCQILQHSDHKKCSQIHYDSASQGTLCQQPILSYVDRIMLFHYILFKTIQ